MKWVTAIIALSLLSLFSNATNIANLDGEVFSPFDKHFPLFYSLAGYEFGLSNRNNGLTCCSTGLQCFEGIRLVFVAVG